MVPIAESDWIALGCGDEWVLSGNVGRTRERIRGLLDEELGASPLQSRWKSAGVRARRSTEMIQNQAMIYDLVLRTRKTNSWF